MVCLDQQCQSRYTSQKPTINTPTVTSYNTLLDYSNMGARSSKTAKVYDPANLATGYSQHSGRMEQKPRLHQEVRLQNVRWPTRNREIHETNGFLGQWQMSTLPTSQQNHPARHSMPRSICNATDGETKKPMMIQATTVSNPNYRADSTKTTIITNWSNKCGPTDVKIVVAA